MLAGRFCDETGCFPTGSYVRNPPGSRHPPSAPDRCVIFVKPQHLPDGETERIVVRIREKPWLPGRVDGLEVMPLGGFEGEQTALVRWRSNTHFLPHHHFGGEEIFVLDGVFSDEYGDYPADSWLRSPHGSWHTPFTRMSCTTWVKTGHLPIPEHW